VAGISLININKSYRGRKVIDNLSLEIKDKEFFAILGPSGCGKTTLLKIIAGLEKHEGTLLFDGIDLTLKPPHQRDVSMVFQSYALYPHKNVRGNISFPLEIKKRPPEEIEKRVAKTALAIDMEVESLLDRKPKELSGGHRQRVALGRAFVKEPQVFLLDEPLSNLDAKIRARTRVELRKWLNPPRATIVYVTADQEEALALANRIAVMNEKGQVEQVGPPQELYEKPLTLFVASYFGTPPMNFFEGKIRPSLSGPLTDSRAFVARSHLSVRTLTLKGGGLRRGVFVTEDFRVELPPIPLCLGGEEETYVLGIRPEDIKVEKEGLQGYFKAELESIENIFPGILLNLKIGSQKCKAKMRESLPPGGEILYLNFPQEKMFLFRRKTGKRVFP
jgi:ABC-type sugar transport system ATPase subunit